MSDSRVLDYVRASRPRFVSELKEFIRFPSVSAQPRRAGDVRRCALWLAAHLRRVGLSGARVYETPRHPIVYAEHSRAPGRPTVLVYGHYDVQPADPVREWRSPPFEPEVRGPYIYGRGACDDKGQLFTHVKAVEAYLRAAGRLPVNVKCLFEGEEEIGSPNLKDFIRRHALSLSADVAVMSDTRMLSPERPAITYSLRGGLSLELEVFGPRRDLHSGNFGGAVHNPLQGLCELVAGLHDARGRVAVSGFYERVREWGRDERAYMARTGPSDAKILRDAGADEAWGERGYTLYERTTIRPALTVNGIGGGYQGAGGKSVIPARAFAKLNVRLVPDQDPREIEQLIRRHFERHTPPALRIRVKANLKARPALLDPRHPVMRAAREAYRAGFGASPVFLRSGGTIPVVNILQEVLGTPTVLMGFALPDDRMHAPDEKFYLPNFFRGIETSLSFLREVARGDRRRDEAAPDSLCAPACKCVSVSAAEG